MAPRDGFEPPAKRLTVACSTAELPGKSQARLYMTKTQMQHCFRKKPIFLAGPVVRRLRRLHLGPMHHQKSPTDDGDRGF